VKEHWCGLDWADRSHAVCVVDEAGGIRARFEIENAAKTFSGLVRRLVKLQVAGVAIERPDGPLVEALMGAGLTVYVVAPAMLKAVRSRYGASGAKSDPGDAFCLADFLRTDRRRLRAVVPDAPATKGLRAVTRTRKDLVDARTALTNQLLAQLQLCFPGAIALFEDLHSPVALAFLRRYPTAARAARLTEARLGGFLRRVHYPGGTQASELLRRIREAPAPALQAEEDEARAACVLALVEAIASCAGQAKQLERRIVQRLGAHPDAGIFTSLPRAGHGVRAASLVAEIGDVRQRFPEAESLMALAGASPVTRASGKHRSVGFRWACDKKLRQAVVDFADASRHGSPWAADVYRRAVDRGCSHSHAVRILARAWLRVIWRCWQDRTPYDVTKHRGAVMLVAA
jgi:transposase